MMSLNICIHSRTYQVNLLISITLRQCSFLSVCFHKSLWVGINDHLLIQFDILSESLQYCQFDTFTATCARDEVIVMEKALYGRIAIGKCVKSDFGFLGCYTDVLPLVDKLCSGRRTCKQQVVDPTFVGQDKPCNNEFKNYLEAQYTCVKGKF